MPKIKKILFPVDLSEVSPKIVPWVLLTARQFEAEVHVVFVARALQYLSSVYVPQGSIETFQEEMIRGAETRMEEFISVYFKDYPQCKATVVSGDPAEEILKYVTSEGIDLVIMGTHGRKGLEKIFFGSVADRVIKTSPVPVMSINPYRVTTD